MDEPTSKQCESNAKVFEDEREIGYAIWYPQMGGYVGKAVVLLGKAHLDGGCFEVLVWHDGEFPFSGGEPRHLHHCDPQQFIDFGNKIAELSKLKHTND